MRCFCNTQVNWGYNREGKCNFHSIFKRSIIFTCGVIILHFTFVTIQQKDTDHTNTHIKEDKKLKFTFENWNPSRGYFCGWIVWFPKFSNFSFLFFSNIWFFSTFLSMFNESNLWFGSEIDGNFIITTTTLFLIRLLFYFILTSFSYVFWLFPRQALTTFFSRKCFVTCSSTCNF